MATYRTQLPDGESREERRGNARLIPPLLTYVSFGGSNGGMVLDVSQNGLAVAAALAVPDASLLNIALPADETHEVIELTGRVVWISESKRRIGVQLVEVSERNQECIRKWVSAIKEEPFATVPTPATPIACTPSIQAISDGDLPRAVPRTTSDGIASIPPAPLPTRDELLNSPLGGDRQPRHSLLVMAASSRVDSEPRKCETSASGELSEKRARAATAPKSVGMSFASGQSALPTSPAANRRSIPDRPRSGLMRIVLAAVAAVIASFAFGVSIGHSAWAQRFLHRAPSAELLYSTAIATERSSDASVPSLGEASSAKSTPLTISGAGADLPPISPSAAVDAGKDVPRVNTDSTATASPHVDTAGQVAIAADADASATGEIFVTPNGGETPLRIDLPEEVLVHSVWLEIRSKRYAMVPGIAPRGRFKPRKARLVIGLLESPVTPQPPSAAYGAAGTQNAEEVVSVRATVGGDGHVVSVDTISGPSALLPCVITAVRQWQYEPSSLNRETVETQAELTFKFRPIR